MGSVRDRASGAPSARGVPLVGPSRRGQPRGLGPSVLRHRRRLLAGIGAGRTRAPGLTAVAARTELRRRERRGRRKQRSPFRGGGGRREDGAADGPFGGRRFPPCPPPRPSHQGNLVASHPPHVSPRSGPLFAPNYAVSVTGTRGLLRSLLWSVGGRVAISLGLAECPSSASP